MPTCLRFSLVFGVLLGSASLAEAQVLQRPVRSGEGLLRSRGVTDPNRTHQELTATVHMLGGYDDDLTPGGLVPGVDPYLSRQSGFTGVATGALDYWVGRAARSLRTGGQIHVTSYSEVVAEPLVGGDANVEVTTTLGERSRVGAVLSANYRPSFVLGAFGPIAAAVEPGALPETSAADGVADLRSVGATSAATLNHSWTPRHRTVLGYDLTRRRFTSDTGLDSRAQGGSLTHHWSPWRTASVRVSYRYSRETTEERTGGDRPLRVHRADLGGEWRKPVSPTRALVFSAGGGATRVRADLTDASSGSLDYSAPSAYATLRLDLARTWAVSLDMRRDVSVLQGLTEESFVANAVAFRAGGQATDRVALALSAALSLGDAPAGQAGAFESANGTVQFDYAVAHWCSLVANYGYYHHLLRDVSPSLAGFPTRFSRNSVRLGFTLTLPLTGRGQRARRAPGRE